MAVAGPVVGKGALLGRRLHIFYTRRHAALGVADVLRLGDRESGLQNVQRLSRVAGGEPHQKLERTVGECHAAFRPKIAAETAFHVGERPPDERCDLVVGERLQAVYAESREQRRVDLEVGVLGGRPDEGHRAVLDMGQERVLLRLVETVYLIDEQQRLRAVEAEPLARFGDDRPDFGDAAHDGGDCDEASGYRLRQHTGKARLAASGRPPQEYRSEVALLEGSPEGSAFADEVLVAHDLIESPRAHPGGERLALGRRHECGLLLAGIAGDGGRSAPRGHASMLHGDRRWGARRIAAIWPRSGRRALTRPCSIVAYANAVLEPRRNPCGYDCASCRRVGRDRRRDAAPAGHRRGRRARGRRVGRLHAAAVEPALRGHVRGAVARGGRRVTVDIDAAPLEPP